MGLIGCNTLRNKRHWQLKWGHCEQCHASVYQSSYDATRTFSVFGISLFPLERVHVHEDCEACQTSECLPLSKWRALRKQFLLPSKQAHEVQPQDPATASALLKGIAQYGDLDEFRAVESQIYQQHANNPTMLIRLAWCHGRFGGFDSAQKLLAESLALVEDPVVRRQAEAYATLPDSTEPRRPSRLVQLLGMLIFPALLVAGFAGWLTFGWSDTIPHAYVVNGLDMPYSVLVNDALVNVPAHGWQQIGLNSGAVDVRPMADGGGFTFTPFQIAVPPGRDTQEPTLIINPDKVAVLSWEQIVYHRKSSESVDGFADQYAFHTGDAYYDFRGVTDHFVEPTETVEVSCDSEATYRYLVRLVDLGTPVGVASVLLSYSEVELAAVYARNLLTHDPSDEGVIELLAAIAPNGETLDFMKPYLEQVPLSLPWHLAYQALEAQLMPEVDQESYYQARLQMEPDNKAILHLLGLVTESPEMAENYWQQAAVEPDRVLPSLQALALRAANQAEFASALQFLELAKQAAPKSLALDDLTESYLIAQGQYGEVIPLYMDRVRADPSDQAAAMTLAGLYEAAGRSAKAQGIVEAFVRTASEADPNLDADSLQGLRMIFRSVMARWGNDPDAFIEITDQLGEGEWTMSALFLKGELDVALGYMGQTKDDPFALLTLYIMALNDNQFEKTEQYLSLALKALEADSQWRHIIVPWFLPDAVAPTLQDTLKVRLDNADRRVLLTALGVTHSELRDSCFALARKLNHDRAFPYLTLKRLFNR